jgi:hypothetical protein
LCALRCTRYRDVLQMSLIDKSLTPDEDALLASVRAKLKITAEDHRQILADCGWTHDEFEGIRKEVRLGREQQIAMGKRTLLDAQL